MYRMLYIYCVHNVDTVRNKIKHTIAEFKCFPRDPHILTYCSVLKRLTLAKPSLQVVFFLSVACATAAPILSTVPLLDYRVLTEHTATLGCHLSGQVRVIDVNKFHRAWAPRQATRVSVASRGRRNARVPTGAAGRSCRSQPARFKLYIPLCGAGSEGRSVAIAVRCGGRPAFGPLWRRGRPGRRCQVEVERGARTAPGGSSAERV